MVLLTRVPVCPTAPRKAAAASSAGCENDDSGLERRTLIREPRATRREEAGQCPHRSWYSGTAQGDARGSVAVRCGIAHDHFARGGLEFSAYDLPNDALNRKVTGIVQ